MLKKTKDLKSIASSFTLTNWGKKEQTKSKASQGKKISLKVRA